MRTSPRRFRAMLANARKPKRAEQKRHFSITGAIGFVISVLAFGFSFVAFWNSIKVEDDARVFISGRSLPDVRLDRAAKRFEVNTDMYVTVSNAGNRNFEVTDIVLELFPVPPDILSTSFDCGHGLAYVGRFQTSEPFVVKANDIAIRRLWGPVVVQAPQLDITDDMGVGICLDFTVITPDKLYESRRVSVEVLTLSKNGNSHGMGGTQINRTVTLVKDSKRSLFN